jgi:acyl-CoA reductase-like NAD-dependent aldehyde dehydrogenase
MHTPGSVHPLTLAPLSPPPPTTTDVAAAVMRARTAQKAWSATASHLRIDLVRQLCRTIVEKRAQIATIIADETGRTPNEALLNEVIALLPGIEGHIAVIKAQVVPERIALSMLDHPGKKLVVEPVPRGVIGIIAPWNYPLSNFFKSLFLALLSGNTVVLKPSEWTPRTGAWLAERCAEVLPTDVVVPIFGDGAVGSALIDAGIDGLVFTGSVATGRKVAAMAGSKLVPVSLELGGKDAAIVLRDCDLDRTVAGVAKWALTNAGQDCSSIERVYVEAAIATASSTRCPDSSVDSRSRRTSALSRTSGSS